MFADMLQRVPWLLDTLLYRNLCLATCRAPLLLGFKNIGNNNFCIPGFLLKAANKQAAQKKKAPPPPKEVEEESSEEDSSDEEEEVQRRCLKYFMAKM